MKVRFILLFVALFCGHAIATPFTTFSFPSTGGSTNRTDPDRWNDLVNIKEFGAVGNGSTDDTAAIQSAIDYAYAHSRQGIFCPAGSYKTTTSLFLDPPGDLRGGGASWSSGTTYSQGAVVTVSGTAYASLQGANLNNPPASSPTFWRAYAYAAGTTYALNDVALSSGVPWISLANSNTGNTPSTASSFWAQTTISNIPVTSAFSMTLNGERGALAQTEGPGCTIKPAFMNGVALWIGPGRGMSVNGVQFIGGFQYRGAQHPNSAGIAISLDASRTTLENIGVANFYTCILIGANGDNLADSNTIIKPYLNNCYNGILINHSQNFINTVHDALITATIAYNNQDGRDITVVDGNPSATGGQNAVFAVTSVSAPIGTANGGTFVTTFTATITTPDSNITACASNYSASSTGLNLSCIYNAWNVVLPSFGPVPLTVSAYNSGTKVATFTVLQTWSDFYFNQAGAFAAAQFSTELQAATSMYANERVTVFYGTGFNVQGVHIENPSVCSELAYLGAGGGPGISNFNSLFFNYDPGLSTYETFSPGTAGYGVYACQQSFPFITVAKSSGIATFNNLDLEQNPSTSPVVIDVATGSNGDFYVGPNTFFSPNIRNARVTGQGWITDTIFTALPYLQVDTLAIGSGHWTTGTPFIPYILNGSAQYFQRAMKGYQSTPFHGWLPDPASLGRLTPGQITLLTGVLPSNLYEYYPVFGNYLYFTSNWNSGATTNHFVKFAHQFASWGQNLSVTWSYIGGGTRVHVSGTSYQYLFSGLYITLDPGNGDGPIPYLVTGYYPLSATSADITVLNLSGGETTWKLLDGTVGTTYTGSTIGQQTYSATQF